LKLIAAEIMIIHARSIFTMIGGVLTETEALKECYIDWFGRF